MSGPLVDEIRGTIQAGLGALEKQLGVLGERTRLKPGERRYVRSVVDSLARRLVVWQELSSDAPELAARLDAIAEQVRALKARRRGCARGDGACTTGSRGHRTEAR